MQVPSQNCNKQILIYTIYIVAERISARLYPSRTVLILSFILNSPLWQSWRDWKPISKGELDDFFSMQKTCRRTCKNWADALIRSLKILSPDLFFLDKEFSIVLWWILTHFKIPWCSYPKFCWRKCIFFQLVNDYHKRCGSQRPNKSPISIKDTIVCAEPIWFWNCFIHCLIQMSF